MDKETKYKRGKNPNSLANLKRGWKDEETQALATQRGHEIQKSNKVVREAMSEALAKQRIFLVKNIEGKEERVTRSALDAGMDKFAVEFAKNPTPQKIETIRKTLGEDETTINVNESKKGRFADMDIPKETKHRIAMILMEETIKR